MRRLFGKIFFGLFNWLIKFTFFFRIFNYVYERLPCSAIAHSIIRIVTDNIRAPHKDLSWKIRLYNGHSVITRIYQGNMKSWQFALVYKLQDPALNILETVLDQYYDKCVPWIDIGSNLGLRSLTALSSGRRVWMFEPNKETNYLNQQRCRLNNFIDYSIVELCLSSIDGEMTFYYDESSYRSSLSIQNIAKEKIIKIENVKTAKLDSYFDLNKLTFNQACIKIDTEGHEFEVIKGGEALINKINPTLIIEINEKNEQIVKMASYFFGLGYEIYEIKYFGNRKILKQIKTDENLRLYNYQTDNFLMIKDAKLKECFLKYMY